MDPPLDTRSSGASPGPPMPGIADQVRVADSQRRAVLARDVRRVRDTAYAPPHHPAKPRLAQRAAARSAAHPPWHSPPHFVVCESCPTVSALHGSFEPATTPSRPSPDPRARTACDATALGSVPHAALECPPNARLPLAPH